MFVAIETSTDAGSIALGHGADLAGEVVVGVRTRHAESLLPALEFLLRTCREDRRSIRGVVVGAGPGSFTGVRVAAATARGLAHGLGVPLYAYSSLAAVVMETGLHGNVCALFDARRGEVYAACYESSDARIRDELLAPQALTLAELRDVTAPWEPVFAGEGADRHSGHLGAGCRIATGITPRASALLRLHAADDAGAGRVADVSVWEPSYLRASGAERGIDG
jgi:tRNA threonylcarbamoyladenosine biosynthesis protein TsaB